MHFASSNIVNALYMKWSSVTKHMEQNLAQSTEGTVLTETLRSNKCFYKNFYDLTFTSFQTCHHEGFGLTPFSGGILS